MLTIQYLQKIKTIIKIAPLAKKAGLNHKYLQVKVARGTPLTISESERLTKVLNSYGFKIPNV